MLREANKASCMRSTQGPEDLHITDQRREGNGSSELIVKQMQNGKAVSAFWKNIRTITWNGESVAFWTICKSIHSIGKICCLLQYRGNKISGHLSLASNSNRYIWNYPARCKKKRIPLLWWTYLFMFLFSEGIESHSLRKSDESLNNVRYFMIINLYSELSYNYFQEFHNEMERYWIIWHRVTSVVFYLWFVLLQNGNRHTESSLSFLNSTCSKTMNAVLRFSFFSTQLSEMLMP